MNLGTLLCRLPTCSRAQVFNGLCRTGTQLSLPHLTKPLFRLGQASGHLPGHPDLGGCLPAPVLTCHCLQANLLLSTQHTCSHFQNGLKGSGPRQASLGMEKQGLITSE